MTSGSGTRDQAASHIPVLLDEAVSALAVTPDAVCIDGTFGGGGYARAILDAGAARLIAIDRDPDAIAGGRDLEAATAGRLTLVQAPFSTLDQVACDAGIEAADAVVLDIGVSSMQLDQPERGFSFMADGPLDMRMARDGPSAADLVNTCNEATLAKIFWSYGEERKSRGIARAIVARRETIPIRTTGELASLVRDAIGPGPGAKSGRHPATKSFQALRIAVNRELEELVEALFASERLLKPGGRLAVVTFHSLEDRIVKRFFRARSQTRPSGSRHAPQTDVPPPSFQIVNLPPVKAGEEEVNANPRARSATLRTGLRTGAAAHPAGLHGLGLPKVEI